MFIKHLLGTEHHDEHWEREIGGYTRCFVSQHCSLQLSFVGTSQFSKNCGHPSVPSYRVTESFHVNLMPAIVSRQRNHLIEKHMIQKSLIGEREREREGERAGGKGMGRGRESYLGVWSIKCSTLEMMAVNILSLRRGRRLSEVRQKKLSRCSEASHDVRQSSDFLVVLEPNCIFFLVFHDPLQCPYNKSSLFC